ncbi:MAG: polysaccharide lyase 11 [Planctomycetota bacterium]|nr:polysaccharide lyase 11 [Planctomycetota bacterium]
MSAPRIELKPVMECALGSPVGQLRAAPVGLGAGAPRAFLVAYAADFDVDPYHEMFFFPTDTLKLVLFDTRGRELWRRDLGKGVVPGLWFCPFLPFDLDGDGVDEIWFVNNLEPRHPLGLSHYRLERLDAATGRTTGQWPWPAKGPAQSISHMYRNFLLGGHVRGEPVLVTAQGTYGDMFLQGWRPGLAARWETVIARDAPGARGSHQTPVVDLDGDGCDEFFWGERCLRFDTGAEVFCADADSYRGHSDVIQPLLDRHDGRWYFYTCRESEDRSAPRVALYDDRGRRVWGALERGHIDMGWVAHLRGELGLAAMAIRIGKKTCGPDGRFHQDMERFAYDARTGRSVELPFDPYMSVPVDLDGDGWHELYRGQAGVDVGGEVLDATGRILADVKGHEALACKFCDLPGEQLLIFDAAGALRVWADERAEDRDAARARYAHPFYAANRRLTGTGYNLRTLGGL